MSCPAACAFGWHSSLLLTLKFTWTSFRDLPPALQPTTPSVWTALAGLMPGVRRCRVLRLHEGDCLEVCDGRGNLVTAQLRGVTHKKRAYAEAVEGVRQARAPRFISQRS